jgi:pilus assembly protein Flp/PilA
MWIMSRLFGRLVAWLDDAERGQGLAEYGLILALVATVAVAGLTLLGTNVGTTLTSIAGSI